MSVEFTCLHWKTGSAAFSLTGRTECGKSQEQRLSQVWSQGSAEGDYWVTLLGSAWKSWLQLEAFSETVYNGKNLNFIGQGISVHLSRCRAEQEASSFLCLLPQESRTEAALWEGLNCYSVGSFLKVWAMKMNPGSRFDMLASRTKIRTKGIHCLWQGRPQAPPPLSKAHIWGSSTWVGLVVLLHPLVLIWPSWCLMESVSHKIDIPITLSSFLCISA